MTQKRGRGRSRSKRRTPKNTPSSSPFKRDATPFEPPALQATPPVQTDTPPVVEENTPPVVPPVVEENTPPVVEENTPPVVEKNTPPVVENNTPLVVPTEDHITILTEKMLACYTRNDANDFLRHNQPIRIQNYIDGAFQQWSSDRAPHILSFIPTKGGLPVAKIPISHHTDVEAATRNTKCAFEGWSRTRHGCRSRSLRKIGALLQRYSKAFAVWESIDQGKTLEQADSEVAWAINTFYYFAGFIEYEQAPSRIVDGKNGATTLEYEHRSPVGAFGLILHWSMPLYQLSLKMAPCLAFGCTAVIKPSENTSLTAFLLALLIHKHEILPKGVLNVVFGDGTTTGAALAASPNIAGVSFTGSRATGIEIRKATAYQIDKRVSLHFSGNNSMIIFTDALISHGDPIPRYASLAAQAAFMNQGEVCFSTSRIYVQGLYYPNFILAFTEHVLKNYRVHTTVGAIATLAQYTKIRSYLLEMQAEGATFETGIVPPESPQGGYWIPPVILTGVRWDSELLREEILGPVVVVSRFDTEGEVLGSLKNGRHGLGVVVVTRHSSRWRRIGEAVGAGVVWVNSWMQRACGAGDITQTGEGEDSAEYSRGVFTVAKTIHVPADNAW